MDFLTINKVSKYYGNFCALDSLDLNVGKGKIFGLLGPNGAGKTTLIRIINCILAPDSGEVLLEGNALKSNLVNQMGYLPEERGLYKKMKVNEQLLYLGQLKGMTRHDANAEINKWCAVFGMETWANKKVEELSKGMQQKVQFIATVLHKPSLLILDEPFSGFDPVNANSVKTEILRLNSSFGTTIIFSTHNMNSVEEICDDVALINKAKKIFQGSVAEVRNSRKESQVRLKFKGNMVGFANALWTDFELLKKTKIGDDLIEATIKLKPGKTVNELLGALIQQVEVFSVEEVLPSLHEIFINEVNNLSNPEEL